MNRILIKPLDEKKWASFSNEQYISIAYCWMSTKWAKVTLTFQINIILIKLYNREKRSNDLIWLKGSKRSEGSKEGAKKEQRRWDWIKRSKKAQGEKEWKEGANMSKKVFQSNEHKYITMKWQLDDPTAGWSDRWMVWQLDDLTASWSNSWVIRQKDDPTTGWSDSQIIWQLDVLRAIWSDRQMIQQLDDLTERWSNN